MSGRRIYFERWGALGSCDVVWGFVRATTRVGSEVFPTTKLCTAGGKDGCLKDAPEGTFGGPTDGPTGWRQVSLLSKRKYRKRRYTFRT